VSPVGNDQWILQELLPDWQLTNQRASRNQVNPHTLTGPSLFANQRQQGRNSQFSGNNNKFAQQSQKNDDAMLSSLFAQLNKPTTNTIVSGNINNVKNHNQQSNNNEIISALYALIREYQQLPNTVNRRNGNHNNQNTQITDNVNVPTRFTTLANQRLQTQNNIPRGNQNNFAQTQQRNHNAMSASGCPTFPNQQQQVRTGAWTTHNLQRNPTSFTRSGRAPTQHNQFQFQSTQGFHGNNALHPNTNRGRFWTRQQVFPALSKNNHLNSLYPFGNVHILRSEVPQTAHNGPPRRQEFSVSPLHILSSEPTFNVSGVQDKGSEATAEKNSFPKKTDPIIEISFVPAKSKVHSGEPTVDYQA